MHPPQCRLTNSSTNQTKRDGSTRELSLEREHRIRHSPARAMEPLRPAPPFDLNSEENREARALFSTTIAQAGGSHPSDRTSGTARPRNTSSSRTATAAPPKSCWSYVCASSSEDEGDRPTHPPASTSNTAIAPPRRAAALGVAVDVAAEGNDGEDSDAEFNQYFRHAALMRPSTTRGSPIPATTSGGPAQPTGADGANGGSSGGSSSVGSSSGSGGKKRRREAKDSAASGDRTPPPSRRTDFGSDSNRDSSSGDENQDPSRRGTGHRRNKPLCPSSRQRNDGKARGPSPRRPSSPGDDGRTGSGSDPNRDSGGRGCDGRGTAPVCRPRTNSAGRRRHEGGTGGMMQVEFDSDSDLGGGAAVKSAEKRGSSQEAVLKEEEEEEEEVGNGNDDDDDDDDDELDDEDGEGLKPTLSHAPFQDTMRALVLTNEAGGQRAEVPAAVNRYLKDYQKEGVEFMYRRVRHADGPKGVILADDMGLGKTVQTISLLLALLKKKGTGQDLKDLNARRKRKEHASAPGKPILIVCPAAVLSSWEKHLAEWGHFASRSILGRNGLRSVQSAESLLDAGLLEVVVVGEYMFRRSVDTLEKLDWLAVVFDEVHHFKNPNSHLARAVEKMKKAEVLIGLTGTLVQNELLDLWTVMNMIEPGCVGARKDFADHIATPYLRGRQRGASRAECEIGAERLKVLQELRAKVVLRREKSILGDLLKGKIGIVVFCDLTEVQKLIYRTVLALPEFRLLAAANEPCPCGRVDAKSSSCCGTYPKDETSEDEVDPKAVIWRRFHPNLSLCDKRPGCPYCVTFSAISKLQKLANHPCQLQVKPLRDYVGEPEKMLHDIAFAQVAFSEQALAIMATRPGDDDGTSKIAFAGAGAGGGSSGGENWDRRLARPENFLQLCRDDTCGKMRTLKVLLKRFHNKDKVLLFSYSTAMLDILQMLCSSEGYTFIRLDGNTSKDQRSKMIERFAKEDAFGSNIFLISTKAGGTGLNLQSANKVILYDVNWNPAQDTQAEDRAYRIGQSRDVEVFRLVSTGTIEELTYMRQIYKLQTSAATMGDKSEGGLRQFEGVQGDSSQKGELWGVSNLMKFSGESMLIKLRQEHGAGLPPLVPDSKDGLLMEPQENIVNVVNKYAAAENSNSGDGGSTEEDQDEDEDQDEGVGKEEEEFDDVGWGGGANPGAGAGADPVKKNAELGGLVMLHHDMVAADQEEELPPGTQESVNEVEMMDDDDTDDGGIDEGMDEAMDEAMDDNGGGGAASDATASNPPTVRQDLGADQSGVGVGHPAAAAAAVAAAVAPPATNDGLVAGAGSGRHGGAGVAGATPRLVNQALALGDADGSDGGPAGAQVEGGEGEQAADEPSWALAPTQPTSYVLVHDHEGEDEEEHEHEQRDVTSSQVVSASSPSGGDVNAICPSAEDPGGLSGGETGCTGGDTCDGCQSIPGNGTRVAGNGAAADGDGVLSQVEAGAGSAAVAVAARGRGGRMPSQFLYAPAAQNVLGVFDYVGGGEEKESREEKKEEEEEEEKKEESKVEEGEHGPGTGGAGGAEDTRERSNFEGSSLLGLDIPFTFTNGDGGNDGVGAGAGGVGPPGNGPVGAGAPPEQEHMDSSNELELALSNFEDVSFSAETQPPPGFV